MKYLRLLTCAGWMACIPGAATSGDPAPELIDPNDERLVWRAHRSPGYTCVLTGTAVSEMRNDAFEVQFRRTHAKKLQLFVIIPGLPKGGTVFMEAPTTRDRWRIFSDSYKPALEGEQAEALRRNVGAGIPLQFTFNYGKGRPVVFETVPKGSITAANRFNACLVEVAQEVAVKPRKS